MWVEVTGDSVVLQDLGATNGIWISDVWQNQVEDTRKIGASRRTNFCHRRCYCFCVILSVSGNTCILQRKKEKQTDMVHDCKMVT